MKPFLKISVSILIIFTIVYTYLKPEIKHGEPPAYTTVIPGFVSDVTITNREKPVYYALGKGYPIFIYESTDLGKTWKAIKLFNKAILPAVHPLYPGIFAASESGRGNSGIFQTTDGGSVWRKKRDDRDIIVNKFYGDSLYTVYLENSTAKPMLSISSSELKTWNNKHITDLRLFPTDFVRDPENKNLMYILFEDRKITRLSEYQQYHEKQFINYSSDGGETWQKLWETTPPLNSDHGVLFCDNKITGVLYRSNSSGVFVTYDRGENWKKLFNEKCITLYRTENDTIFLLTTLDVYFSKNNGSEWSKFDSTNYDDKFYRYLSMDIDELNKNILIGTTRGVKIVSYGENKVSKTN